MYRIRRLSIFVALVTVTVVGLSAPPAHAAGVEVTCGGTEAVTYDPGVTLTPQLVTLTGKRNFSSCESPTEPDVTWAMNSFSFQDTRSCATIADVNAGVLTIAWNTGQTSLVDFSTVINNIGGQIVATLNGIVIDGLFQDSTMVMTTTGPVPNPLLCLTTGIKSRTGVVTLTLTSL